GPPGFLPDGYMSAQAAVVRDFDSVLSDVDVVMLLRIQRERFADMPLSDQEYIARYRLEAARLRRMRDDAIVMHPGPYHRGVELDDSVLEFAGWRYASQVMHGVPVRMALLDFLVNGARALVA